jgi:hypothetical protein
MRLTQHTPHGGAILGLLVFGLALTVYLGTAGGSLATTDAVVSYDVTRQLVEHGAVALSSNLVGNEAYRGLDGRYYSPFGLAQSLWNVPFYLTGRAAATLLPRGHLDETMVTKAAVALGNAVAAGICVWLVWLLARRTGAGARLAVGTALAAGFCTSLWPYSKFGYNAPLAALFGYTSAMRSLTQGRGTCTLEPHSYGPAPQEVLESFL